MERRLIHAVKPMRRRIRDGEAVCESAVGDLILIVGVTPASDATGGIGASEFRKFDASVTKEVSSALRKRRAKTIPSVQSQ